MNDKKLKEIDCAPECGFMVRSHNEDEVVKIARKHAMEMHDDNPTDDEMKKMMKIV